MPPKMQAASRLRSQKTQVPVATGPGSTLLHLGIFFLLFTVPLISLHLGLLNLPYFWDEHGQFVPTALDLLRDGSWVAHSTVPNIHPPGVEAYLVLWYKIFGYSIAVTRLAMLVMAGAGLVVLFLLSMELTRGVPGLPAFLPPLLLVISPLFYMQSMMAQLDMPAMVFTLLVLLLFLRRRYMESALASVALVLVKETGAVTPAVLFGVLVWRRQFRSASFYLAAPVALGTWLLVLHHKTGYWTGDPGFEHYNIAYSLHPVRVFLTLFRRLYYLFFSEFRWMGTLLIFFLRRKLWAYRSPAWAVTGLVCAGNVLLVTLLGGAALERYLLPVLPVFYILLAMAICLIPGRPRVLAAAALCAGLAASIFWNPPYPFPFENNFAMVDFVNLQEAAGSYAESHFPGLRIATAWPFTAALHDPDYGYVSQPQKTVETNDLHVDSIRALPRDSYDVLIVYTRTWSPEWGFENVPFLRAFLARFYNYEPDISNAECISLGLQPAVSWTRRGQQLTIYERKGTQQLP